MMLTNCLLSYSMTIKKNSVLGFVDVLLEKTMRMN